MHSSKKTGESCQPANKHTKRSVTMIAATPAEPLLKSQGMDALRTCAAGSTALFPSKGL
jgi:hypothetical protein